MDKRILEMCREIDKAKLATAQEGVTVWAEKLLDELDEANKALRIAVGLLSTYPKLSSQHPEYTFEYILKMAREKTT